jgi:hypothetical protein
LTRGLVQRDDALMLSRLAERIRQWRSPEARRQRSERRRREWREAQIDADARRDQAHSRPEGFGGYGGVKGKTPET